MAGTKTMGIYKITSEYDTNFTMLGSSSQIEVCTKDYISWIRKGKAPPKMQQAYNDYWNNISTAIQPEEFFKVNIIKICDTPEELTAAKQEFGLGSTGGGKKKIVVDSSGVQVFQNNKQTADIEKQKKIDVLIIDIDWQSLYECYEGGTSVKNICEAAGITSYIFYQNIKQFRK